MTQERVVACPFNTMHNQIFKTKLSTNPLSQTFSYSQLKTLIPYPMPFLELPPALKTGFFGKAPVQRGMSGRSDTGRVSTFGSLDTTQHWDDMRTRSPTEILCNYNYWNKRHSTTSIHTHIYSQNGILAFLHLFLLLCSSTLGRLGNSLSEGVCGAFKGRDHQGLTAQQLFNIPYWPSPRMVS